MVKHLRTVFFSILLLNFVFFAWAQGYFGAADSNREPQRLANQLAAERLHISNMQAATPVPSVQAIKPPAVEASPPVPVAVPVAAPASSTRTTVPDKETNALICRRIIGTSEDQVKRLQTTLTAKMPGAQSSLQSAGGSASYWVHIPAQTTRVLAEKKGVELRRLGITDFHIMSEESSNRNAISLGLFRSEQSARDLLSNLGKKGVKSARIEVRGAPSTQQLEVRATETQMNLLPQLLKKSPALTLTECTQ